MQLELVEYAQIIEGDWDDGPSMAKKPTPDELTRSLQVLLARQCIYSYTPGLGRIYEIIRHYTAFFERYFAALGYRLVVSNRDQMIALSVPIGETRYDAVYERLKKDKSIVLLGLRLIWEEAISGQDIGDYGVAETTTGDLVDRIKNVTQQDPPDENRLTDILRMFARRGAVKTGVRDRIERVTPLSVLPGVAVIAPDAFVEELRLWAASPPDLDKPVTIKLPEPIEEADEDENEVDEPEHLIVLEDFPST